ncbi:MAG TPA: hypothetical protein VLE23_01650 [Geminicoccaceae bacterium]|nr:hypothetical protein [Geminicoccaceae bacterium]
MVGRVLFALVLLIIAAGVALPLYPTDVPAPAPPAAATALLVADTVPSGCVNDAKDAGCRSTCPCGQALATPSAAPETCICLAVYLVVRPASSGPSLTPQPPPPKLPAI